MRGSSAFPGKSGPAASPHGHNCDSRSLGSPTFLGCACPIGTDKRVCRAGERGTEDPFSPGKAWGVTWGPTVCEIWDEIGKKAARCQAKKALEPEIVWGTVQTSRTLAFSPSL